MLIFNLGNQLNFNLLYNIAKINNQEKDSITL